MRSILTASDSGLSVKVVDILEACVTRLEMKKLATGPAVILPGFGRGSRRECHGRRSHRVAPEQLAGAEQVSHILLGGIALGVVGDRPARVVLAFVNPAQVGTGAPAKHIVVGLVRPGLGQELEGLPEHQLGLIEVVSFQVGQGQIVGGVDVQPVLNFRRYQQFLVVDHGSHFRKPEPDIILDRFIEFAPEMFDPRVDQGKLRLEQEQRSLDRGNELGR